MEQMALLNARSHEVLGAVVYAFISTGEPVGSRTLARKFKMKVSPATIRNTMSDLEDMGYLYHPHPSAGRIPTDKGYRYFVNNHMNSVSVSEEEKKRIFERLVPLRERTNRLLREATGMLSDLAKGMGVAVCPDYASQKFKNIQFIRLRNKQIIAMFVSDTGFVIDRVINLEDDYTQDDLDRISRFANTEFSNMTFHGIRQKVFRLMGEQQRLYDEIVRKSLKVCVNVFSGIELMNNELIINPEKLIDNPEFSDLSMLRETLRTFEDKNRLLDLLLRCVFDTVHPVNISIGKELFPPELDQFSLVTSTYRYEDQILGSLGIIGPKRMNYAKIAPMVRYIADLISDLVTGEDSLNKLADYSKTNQ